MPSISVFFYEVNYSGGKNKNNGLFNVIQYLWKGNMIFVYLLIFAITVKVTLFYTA